MMLKSADIVRAKIEIFAAMCTDQSGKNIRAIFLAPLDEMIQANRCSKVALRRLDQDIERFIRMASVAEQTALSSALRIKFGAGAVGEEASVVVRRILKRGRIVGDHEAELALDFVSNSSNENEVGVIKFRELAELIDRAGY